MVPTAKLKLLQENATHGNPFYERQALQWDKGIGIAVGAYRFVGKIGLKVNTVID